MKESKKNKLLKPIDKLTLSFLIVIVFSILGFILTKIGKHNYNEIKIKYQETSDVNYKVYLKKNDFFEEEYLEMNKTYITSLIDKIEINFKYNLDIDDFITTDYTYYIKGIISANKVNGEEGSYWEKAYILTDKITNNIENTNSIEIDNTIMIDYQQYNDILNSFKKEYGLAMNGNLKIILVIKNNINTKKIDRNIVKDSNIELNIPLTSLTIEVPIEIEGISNEGLLLNDIIYKDNIGYIISKILGYFFFMIAIISLIYLIYLTIIRIKQESIYYKNLRKILKVYDSILVEVNTIPKLNKFNIISVKNFEELIDAHSEVRRPINFIYQKEGVKFLLISENIIWIYELKRELYNKERSSQI